MLLRSTCPTFSKPYTAYAAAYPSRAIRQTRLASGESSRRIAPKADSTLHPTALAARGRHGNERKAASILALLQPHCSLHVWLHQVQILPAGFFAFMHPRSQLAAPRTPYGHHRCHMPSAYVERW